MLTHSNQDSNAEHKSRVLVVLASDEFIRNYLEANAFDDLRRDTDLRIIATNTVTKREFLEGDTAFAGYFKSFPKLEEAHYGLFNILMWRYRRRSSSFRFRIKRHVGIRRLYEASRTPGIGSKVRALAHALRYVLRRENWQMIWRGSRIGSSWLIPLFIRRLPVNISLTETIHQLKPELIVFPSSAYDPIGNDVVRICRSTGITCVFLVDNWDGMSSKSIFWARPDVVGVWGNQSNRHAIEIQGFTSSQVRRIGTPRFEQYFAARRESLASPFKFAFALFVGCCLAFDEVSALRVLDDEINKNPEIYGGLKIVYRPHPWRHPRREEENFDEETFDNVVLDPQLRGYDERGERLYPALDYYAPLLANARFVVAPLTTMLVEALLFNKANLVIAYDDGIHYDSPHRAWKNYEHFKGIERFPNVRFCHHIHDLASGFRSIVVSPPDTDPQMIDHLLQEYLYWDDRSYSVRLRDLVSELLTNDESARAHLSFAGLADRG